MELKSIGYIWEKSISEYKDNPFITYQKSGEIITHSFYESYRDINSIGAYLNKNYISGTHMALIGTSGYEYLVSWFGTALSGNVCVPLNPENSVTDLADEINRSDSEVVFFDKSKSTDTIMELKNLCPQIREFISLSSGDDERVTSFEKIVRDYEDEKITAETSAETLAAIFFTSGTTGKSKGVMLTHGNLYHNTVNHRSRDISGRRLTVLPVHHAYCFTCDVLSCLYFGKELCINDSLRKLQKNLILFKPHTVTFVPMIAQVLLNKMNDYAAANPEENRKEIGKKFFGENLQIIYCGGAYLSPAVVDGYSEFEIEIEQGYGMTECSPRICTVTPNKPLPGSVGEVTGDTEVKIVDGEIWVKSGSVMKGYYKNPEETAKVLTEDGWLRTGDLGYIEKTDAAEFVFITGRMKNLIILSNGENVSPEELENRFAGFRPVKEIVVYAKDEMITAEIFPEENPVSDETREIIQKKTDEINKTLPSARRIAKIIYRDTEFEKSSSKKIIRSSLNK